jgi:putative ABC transport system permease protein
MFRRRRGQEDFNAEIEAHLRLEADRLKEGGLSEAEAETAARRGFGSVLAAQERFYESGRWLLWDHLKQDVRYAFGLMRRNGILTAAIILTLALGIGANAAVFSVVHAVVLRPLDYREPDRIVQAWETGARPGGESDWLSFPNFRDWQRENHVFEAMAAYSFATFTMTGSEGPEAVLGLQVTDRLFAVLGVAPILGRTLLEGEDAVGRGCVAVISDALWGRRFGRDPGAAGRAVDLDGRPCTIVGVMPAAFRFPNAIPGANVPVAVDAWITPPIRPDLQQRGSHNFWAVGRLRPGLTIAQARVDMDALGLALAREHPDTNDGMTVALESLQDHVTQSVRPALYMLLAAVWLVLLLACANIANLLIARSETRRRETALRQALGAGRGRLLLQALTESLLLALLGAAAGLLMARLGTSFLLARAPADIPRIEQTRLGAQVVGFTALVAAAAGLVFGLIPALLGTRSAALEPLREASARATAGPAPLAIRRLLVASQMALAVMLLVGSGLLIRSLARLLQVDPGFRGQVIGAFIGLAPSRYPDPPKQIAFHQELLRRVRALPGVEVAAVADSVPLTGVNNQGGFGVEGIADSPQGRNELYGNRPRISSDYFTAMGIPLLEGRMFDEHDSVGSPPVAIVSDLTARRFWPGRSALGKRVCVDWTRSGPDWREIVGVVQTTRHFGLEAPPKPEIYIPYRQSEAPFVMLVVRTGKDLAGMVPEIQREIAAIDRGQAALGFLTIRSLLDGSSSRRRFQTGLLSGFAGLAALLASIGVYGVVAYTVTRRTREIGVRLAIGARPGQVVALVFRQGALLTLAGVGIGLVSAVALARLLAGLLFGVSPLDGPTFAAAFVLLTAVAGVSTYLPSRRAARVDPVRALREE